MQAAVVDIPNGIVNEAFVRAIEGSHGGISTDPNDRLFRSHGTLPPLFRLPIRLLPSLRHLCGFYIWPAQIILACADYHSLATPCRTHVRGNILVAQQLNQAYS
jgi:hypothetical protein